MTSPGFCSVWCISRLVLGHVSFLIYTNDLNQAIKLCKVHHFTDNRALLHFTKSITKFNKYLNVDMKNLTNWLNANKISLNMQKTKLVFFSTFRTIRFLLIDYCSLYDILHNFISGTV